MIALFDMERSGAGMAWDFVHADLGPLRARPRLVDLVEDRDLWRFRHGDDSRFLHLALTSGETSFQRWEDACEFVDAFVARGQAISAYRDMLVAEIAAPAPRSGDLGAAALAAAARDAIAWVPARVVK